MDTRRWYDVGIAMLVLALVGSCGNAVPAHPSVLYSVQWIRNTRVHVVTVDLNDRTIAVKPMLAYNRLGKRQSFVSFLARSEPLAQITGNFFSMDNNLPVGDIMIDGQMWYYGFLGSALALTGDNAARIITFPRGWKYEWPGYENVLRGGVLLVENGNYTLAPRTQGFHDPALYAPASRTAVGIRADRRLLLVAVSQEIYLSQLARIMLALGCREAMAMDGGNSTGLAYDCDVKLMPRRTLASVLIVTTRPTNWPPTPAEPAAPSVTDVPSAWLFHPGVLANFAQFRYSKPPATLADNPRPEEVPLLPTGENDLTGVLPTRKRHPA